MGAVGLDAGVRETVRTPKRTWHCDGPPLDNTLQLWNAPLSFLGGMLFAACSNVVLQRNMSDWFLESGTEIADYPDDRPLPSILLMGFRNERAIHVLVAKDAEGGCYVVTAYIPVVSRWMADFRTRR